MKASYIKDFTDYLERLKNLIDERIMKKNEIKITELFGIKILDNIKNYLHSKKNSKNHGFYSIGKYRGQRYTTDKINLVGSPHSHF